MLRMLEESEVTVEGVKQTIAMAGAAPAEGATEEEAAGVIIKAMVEADIPRILDTTLQRNGRALVLLRELELLKLVIPLINLKEGVIMTPVEG